MCSSLNPCLVLIVDDEDQIRRMFDAARGLFLSNGLDLVVASSLREAATEIARRPFDVVLLDLNLPQETAGAETVRRIAALTKAPIIAFTGSLDGGIREVAITSGAKDFLLKTEIDLPALAGVLRDAAAQYRERRRIEGEFDSLIARTG